MNLVERWFGELTTKLRRGARHVGAPSSRLYPRLDRCLEQRTQAYVWTKTADQILESISRCTTIADSGH